MTVKLLGAWGAQPSGTKYSSDSVTEAAMVAAKVATADLTNAVDWDLGGSWLPVPTVFRLRIAGTGSLQMDSRDSLGGVTLAAFPLTTYAGETDKIEFPYAGDDAVAIRLTTTGTLTCEVI